MVKRGARGILVRTHSETRELPALEANVVDTTGAGDALAAGFLVGGPELASSRRALRRTVGSDAVVAELLRIHPEVRAALEARRPVAALETTLVAHGFPRGEGAEVAAEAERRVRMAGRTGHDRVIDGRICVGLEEGEPPAFRRHAGRAQGRPCAISPPAPPKASSGRPP